MRRARNPISSATHSATRRCTWCVCVYPACVSAHARHAYDRPRPAAASRRTGHDSCTQSRVLPSVAVHHCDIGLQRNRATPPGQLALDPPELRARGAHWCCSDSGETVDATTCAPMPSHMPERKTEMPPKSLHHDVSLLRSRQRCDHMHEARGRGQPSRHQPRVRTVRVLVAC